MPKDSKRSEWRRRLVERNLHTVEFIANVLHSALDAFHPSTNILYFVVDALRGPQTLCSSHATLLLSQFVESPQRIIYIFPSH
jgi:hypothetical protein